MALPATDSFTGSDGTSLPTYSGNWTVAQGEFLLYSNGLRCNNTSVDSYAIWNADSFDADQYAECDMVAIVGTTYGVGVMVRANATSGGNGYGFEWNSSTGSIFKAVNGGWSALGGCPAPTPGTRVRLEVTGSETALLEVFYDDVSKLTAEDSSSPFLSGACGVCGYSANTGDRIDNWEGGNLGGAASIVPQAMANYINQVIQ